MTTDEFMRKLEAANRGLRLLEAKAAVCDAYRAWLAKPERTQRTTITQALAKLVALEREQRERDNSKLP